MSVKALNWAFDQKTELPVDKIILLALADFADQDNYCFPGQEVLAERGMCSVDTVQRVLKRLEASGRVQRSKRYSSNGHRISDSYRLLTDTSGGEQHRKLRSSKSGTIPQTAVETTPQGYAETTPQSCGVYKEPPLNQKKEDSAEPISKKLVCRPDGVVFDGTKITLDSGNRAFWLEQFENDERGLELALLQAANYVQPNNQKPMFAQVGAQLARAVASKRDQDKRYAAAVSARSNTTAGPRQGPKPAWAAERDEKKAAARAAAEKVMSDIQSGAFNVG